MHSFALPSLSNERVRRRIAALAFALLLAGCASHRPAPVEDRAPRAGPPPAAVPAVPPVAGAPAAPVAPPAPVPTYTVKRGDTLHQIALDTGLDYRELAAWNNIENANVIRVGQVLRLTAPGSENAAGMAGAQDSATGVTTAPLRAPPAVVVAPPAGAGAPAAPPPPVAANSPPPVSSSATNVKTSPKALKEPYSDQAVRDLSLAASAVPAPSQPLAMNAPSGPPAAAAKPESKAPPPAPAAATAGDSDAVDWAWPAKGKVVSGFSETANLKGIDIAGTAGQAVTASAAGRVVYAGTGLRGYGKLIIIKHNATFLSAYAHNREILVKEGQQVTRGQKIAEMGNTDAEQVKLHFEIRRQGKPMDPTKYLPPA